MLHSRRRAFVNTGDSRHLRLALREAHADTANLCELTRPPADPQVSLSITRAQVAGVEPAMIKLLLGRFRVIEVSTADRGTAHLDLASLSIGKLLPLVIHDPDRQIVQWDTATAQ